MLTKEDLKFAERLRQASQISGFRRYATDPEYVKEYSCVGKWALDIGADAVRCLENLEQTKPELVASNLRFLSSLMTKEARLAILPVFQKTKVTVPDVEEAVKKEEKAMWLRWHWQPYKNCILAEKLADSSVRASFARSTRKI